MENSFIGCCKTKKPGFHRETRADNYRFKRRIKRLFHCFCSIDCGMASGIRSKSKCVAGEEVRVGRSDHIGDFQAGSIESGYRFVMCIQNLMLSVRDQATVGAEEVRLKLQSVVLLAVDRFQIAAILSRTSDRAEVRRSCCTRRPLLQGSWQER